MDYTIATFRNNAADLGVWPALSKDWSKTKQHLTASLEGLLRRIGLNKASLTKEESKLAYLEPGQKVIVNMPACHDCNSPPIQRKGVIIEYLGMEDPTRGSIISYPHENKYLVRFEKGNEITCFESNLR